jgi:hypothetical protein
MSQSIRFAGIALLAVALLNASAGLCSCHRGQDSPVGRIGHSCCHPAGDEDALAVRAVPTCCHIEAAQRDMTATDAVTLATSAPRFENLPPAAGDEAVVSHTLAPAPAPSPPVRVLRL